MSLGITHVVLTRTVQGATPWRAALRELALHVDVWPCIAVQPITPSTAALAALQQALSTPALCIACTSAHGATSLAAWLGALGQRLPSNTRGAAVGPATASAMQTHLGLAPSVRAPFDARSLARRLCTELPPHSSVLLPRSSLADDALESMLRAAGHAIMPLTVYETTPLQASGQRDALPWAGKTTLRDWCVVVASPSAVMGLQARLAGRPSPRLLALGPRSWQAAVARLGGEVHKAPQASLAGVLRWFQQQRAW